MGEIWNFILRVLISILLVISNLLFHNFGLAIIVFTILIRAALYPLTARQLRSTKNMQELQPKLLELQKKYGGDRQRMAQEQMRLYREAGMNPVGCVFPMLIQLPIWIALYQSIVRVVGAGPEDFLGLSQFLFSWDILYTQLPVSSHFLWMNLAVPDSTYILPALTFITMWIQQKMITPNATDPQQAQQNRLMLWMMPAIFAYMTVTFPSGLALYWAAGNVISIIMQYFASGWGGMANMSFTLPSFGRGKSTRPEVVRRSPVVETKKTGEPEAVAGGAHDGESDGESGDKREDSGRGDSKRLNPARRPQRRNKGNRSKGR